MRATRALALALLALLGACRAAPAPPREPLPAATSPSPPPSPSPSPRPYFPTQRAVEHTRALAVEIGPRPAGSEGEQRAAGYVEAAMRAAGLDVERRPATRRDGLTSDNVVGRPRGADLSRGYAVVGAHYDTVEASPGGNDNGSGTGVVLALAEALGGLRLPVELVAFAAEEQQPTDEHHVGSRAFVAGLSDPGAVRAMLSIDMIAGGPTLLVGMLRGSPPDLRNEVAAVAADLGVPHEQHVAGDVSDHGPFARAGIPAAWLWSGRHPAFHTAGDTFDVVQPEAVDRAGRVALEWLLRRAGL